MSRGTHRQAQPSRHSPDAILLYTGLALLAAACAGVYGATHLAAWLTGDPAPPADPWATLFGVLDGTVAWTPQASIVLAALLVALTVAVAAVLVVRRRGRRGRSRVDDTARVLGRHHEITPITTGHATATATRLGAPTPGVRIGTAVSTGNPVWGTWEDMHIDIWGPRTGKTTSRAIPAILEAPGAVLVTSNKRDVIDATRGVRRTVGQVWVFDPQHLAGESPDWWWDPLSYVTDEVKAARLAEHFAAGSRAPGARTDAFFDPAGQDVLAALLLAAAVDGRPITDVYRWLTRPTDDTAVDLLNAAGYPLTADQLAGHIAAPDRQRGGVFGTAAQMASCLTNRQAAAWVTPAGPLDPRPHFDPATFIGNRDSLYLLSREGRGSAGPLTTALTVAVIEAAEDHARTCPGGRLPVPLLGVLDEAANVCRWQDLPDLYSHFGSRGIVLMTILQSWSQGVQVWGEAGMRKLWSAANVAVYGGGVKESDFLDMLSRLIGDHDKHTRSVSTGRGHRSVTAQLSRERILDPADLAALPPGRAVVLASGARPTLIQTQPWMSGPHASAVRDSLATHSPGARP
jgi:type IV secretory pathway TraG/TraD family ATPase VirD4